MAISGTRSLVRGGYVQEDGYVQGVGMSGEMSTHPPPSTDMGPEKVRMSRGLVPNAPKHGTRKEGWVCQGGEYPTTPSDMGPGERLPNPPLRTWDTMEYGWQAVGTHPTGMLSFYACSFFELIPGSDTYEGDYVIITVPLGVLKTNTITFSPVLSQEKLKAIEDLGGLTFSLDVI